MLVSVSRNMGRCTMMATNRFIVGAAFAVALFLPILIAFSSENTKNDATVIILGGGVAGIQAAAQLTQQGIKDFMIIEQANRIGGRMWNIEWEGVSVELGKLLN